MSHRKCQHHVRLPICVSDHAHTFCNQHTHRHRHTKTHTHAHAHTRMHEGLRQRHLHTGNCAVPSHKPDLNPFLWLPVSWYAKKQHRHKSPSRQHAAGRQPLSVTRESSNRARRVGCGKGAAWGGEGRVGYSHYSV